MCICCDCFVTDTMSSSESGLFDTDDPMAIVSDDEIAPEPEIFTSDTESDPEMMSDDDDDFQPFALPDFGVDFPIADGIPDEDPFAICIPFTIILSLVTPMVSMSWHRSSLPFLSWSFPLRIGLLTIFLMMMLTCLSMVLPMMPRAMESR
ncbi:hypothetical protein HanHA300_Chr01g0022761 [Helianthus annuus]|nr:hypothetical protein HanHA300_Chr01g0022761 [Helianthus annuus]